jgi:uncharacterized phage protein (TIGR01671 family)
MKLDKFKFRKYHLELDDMMYSKNASSLSSFLQVVCNYPEQYDLMQFSGLHDLNGTEIYEGDIIKCINEEDDLKVIVFSSGAFSAYHRESNTYCTLNHYGTPLIEVIGNKYENKDLL